MFAQENDQVADATLIWNYHETLRYRNPALREYSMMSLGREKCPNSDRFDRILPVVDGDAIIDHLKAEALLDTDRVRTFCKRDLGSTLTNFRINNPPSHLGYTVEQLDEVFFQTQVMFSAHHPGTGGNHSFLSYLGDMLESQDPWTELDIPPTTSVDVHPFGLEGLTNK